MKTELFFRFVGLLENATVPYAVVGNTEAYPENVGGETDILVSPEDMPRILGLVWQIEDAGTRVVNRVRRGGT